MKVTCLIDSLSSGGAQRQLCTLAVLLKKQGMDVTMLTYHPFDFFLPVIREAGVKYRCVEGRSVPQRILAIRRALRREEQDVVLAFLDAPCFYAELAAIPGRKWGLVVSERSSEPGIRGGWRRWMRLAHLMADSVITNSHTNRLMIERSIPSLKDRIITVYNVVDLKTFSPLPARPPAENPGIRLMAAANFLGLKNHLGFVEAIAIVSRREPALEIHLDWYGGLPNRKNGTPDDDLYNAIKVLIEKHGLQSRVRLHPPSPDIINLYRSCDAVVLPSFYEGLSNVVCEAMACGRPVLASYVSDTGNLVKDGYNGFVFDPTSPEDMAKTVIRLARLTGPERELFGQRGRQMAERMFNPETIASRYVEILTAAAERKHVAIEHWIPEVPDSAYRSLN